MHVLNEYCIPLENKDNIRNFEGKYRMVGEESPMGTAKAGGWEVTPSRCDLLLGF